MSLKQKTISGLIWSFIDNTAKEGILFIIGIILARILTPREFGLMGMTSILIFISDSFIDSGFGQALVRKKQCTQTDYSTVFYFNLSVGISLFIIMFFSAEIVSNFFSEPKLKPIIQIMGIGLIIKSLSLIHQIILIRRIDFKLQTKVSVLATIGSGFMGIYMAYNGYGVWSLVLKTLTGYALTSALLWYWNSWKPSFEFSTNSFKEMFSFGSKLLITGFLDKIYKNMYLLIIGKYFSASQLGYYTRADLFKSSPSESLTVVIQRVSFPTLASIQDDITRLKYYYRQLIKSTMFLVSFLMVGMATVAESLIISLIGKKWLPSVIFLQLLSFVGLFFPLQAINQNMLKVKGFSNIILKIEIIKKISAIPVVIIGIMYGIKMMIVGMIIHAISSFFLDSYYSGKTIAYSSLQQLKDIAPSFLINFIVGGLIFIAGKYINTSASLKLIIEGSVYIIIVLGLCEIFKLKEFVFIKQIIFEQISLLRVNNTIKKNC